MTETLAQRVESALDRETRAEVTAFAAHLAQAAGAEAVLFYGSNLRTGSLDGVLDFYVLLPGEPREAIWPRVGYVEWQHGETLLRAKVATMDLGRFARAAAGRSRDTTIWTRFVQPSTLVFARNDLARARVAAALADAAMVAGELAAALGPESGTAEAYWRALFQATYKAEFRVEKPGREDSILANDPAHFDGLLPAAWAAADVPFEANGGQLTPMLAPRRRKRLRRWWNTRRRLGKPLNILRLAKATTTFDGAAAYAAWKLHRHTGIALAVTPFREKHPLLAMPGAAWELWRRKRAQR